MAQLTKQTKEKIMSRYDDDDETEIMEEAVKPTRASRKTDDDEDKPVVATKVIRGGWGAVEQAKSADSPYAQRLRISEDTTIIKFLEDEPYATYRQHWVERTGQKSFTCIADLDPKGCPLCDAGSRPSTRFAFNVVLLSSDSEPMHKSYEVGPRVIDQLKNFHIDPRQGPLSKHFWAVSRSGKGATSATNHQLVKERDLEEWNIDGLTEDDFKVFRSDAYTSEIIQIPTRKDLTQIALEDLSD